MRKVLIITDVSFWLKSSGSRTRIAALIEFLAARVLLTVVHTGPVPDHTDAIIDKLNISFAVLDREKYLSSNSYGKRLKHLLMDKDFDAVIIEYIHNSFFLNYLDRSVTTILDSHDLISERSQEFRNFNYTTTQYDLSQEEEQRIFKIYDKVMAICKPDYDLVAATIGKSNTLLCPHPVAINQLPFREKMVNIVFVASSYIPNIDGINWFIQNCWGTLVEKYDVQLVIYGTVCQNVELNTQRNIILKGFVSDEKEIYADADVVINPVRFGAGIKIKNLEALAHGLPLVTTTHGARGLNFTEDCEAYFVADQPEDFIESIIILVENAGVRKKLRQHAMKLVNEKFSAKECFKPLTKLLNI